MNQITLVINQELREELDLVFDHCVYWTNNRANVYVLYGLPVELQYELENSLFPTYNSRIG